MYGVWYCVCVDGRPLSTRTAPATPVERNAWVRNRTALPNGPESGVRIPDGVAESPPKKGAT